MKFLFAFFGLILITKQSAAQDTILKRDKQIVIASVLEISETEVKYKRFGMPDGPLFIDNKSDIAYIRYSNGQKDIFPAAPVQAQPGALPITAYGISVNRISYVKFNTWEQKSLPMSEAQMHNVLLQTKDAELTRLVKKARFAKKNQYVALLAIPAGIAGITLGYAATMRTFGVYNYGASDNDPGGYILGSFACAVIALSTNIYGASMFHAHRRKNAQAIELYNQTY